MTPSKALFLLCISFIVGIFFSSIIKIPQVYIWGIFIAGVIFLFLPLISTKKNFLWGFLILFFAIGLLRFQISEFDIYNSKLIKLNDQDKVIVSGVIVDEPEVRETSQKLKVKVLDGLVLITTSRYPEYKYLDKLKIEGKFKTPTETEDFSYKNYLMKDGIYSIMGFPKIEITGTAKAGLFENIYSGILFLKQKTRQVIQKNFTPPYSQVLQGIIIGDKNAISTDVKNKFSVTGVSHIVAVSGSHIVILSEIILGFLLAIGMSRKQSFYFIITFICFYILLVGLPASGIRSGIMAFCLLLAQYIGRQNTSSRMIVIAGAIMLIFNPMLLLYDIGFQLSFLAVFGLIYLEPIIRYYLKFLINNDGFVMMVSATLSAQIFTLPIIIYNFGNISFVSPIVNVLILPVVYYIMLFGFISALVGIVVPWVGWVLSIPCHFLMVYFMWVVDIFSKNWGYGSFNNMPVYLVFVFYFILFLSVRYLRKNFLSFI